MKRHLLVPCVAAALLLAPASPAQELPSATPEAVGMSSERLSRIATAVERDIAAKRVAGMVTMVVRHGRVVWYEAQGMADREQQTPMRRDAIFRICSMTKPIATTALMILYEEGRFALDDPVSEYLPEFKDPKVLVTPATGQPYTVAAKRGITVRDLLRHTSGLTYQWNEALGQRYVDANVASGLLPYDGTIADSVSRLAGLPLLFNPGERFEYSLSIDVVGRLVEVLSGEPLDVFMRTRILDPLDMRDTCFFVSEEQLPRLAAAYTYYPDKGLARFPDTPITEGTLVYSADYPYKGPRKLFSGGAGLCSTARDYARFCQMILNGGSLNGVQILSRKTVELMTHDQLGKIAPEWGFGLGFGVSGVKAPLGDLGSPGEYGWGGFFYTKFNIDPKEDMIVISMGQLHPTGGLALDTVVQNLAYQALNQLSQPSGRD